MQTCSHLEGFQIPNDHFLKTCLKRSQYFWYFIKKERKSKLFKAQTNWTACCIRQTSINHKIDTVWKKTKILSSPHELYKTKNSWSQWTDFTEYFNFLHSVEMMEIDKNFVKPMSSTIVTQCTVVEKYYKNDHDFYGKTNIFSSNQRFY